MVEPVPKQKYRINYEKLLLTCNLNILFLIDATGSMDPYKNLCCDSISLILNKLSNLNDMFPQGPPKVKFAYLAYRDKCDKENQFEICNFIEDLKEVKTKVQKIECIGGGDTCEDVKEAFKKVVVDPNIQWNSQYKFIVMIADSPSHGKKYYNDVEISDDYPEEDMTNEIKRLALDNIIFLGILFDESTKKMYDEIEMVYKANHGKFHLIEHEDLKNIKSHEKCSQNIINLFVDKISVPIENFTKSTLKQFYQDKKISAFFRISDNFTDFDWNKLPYEETFLKPEKYEMFNFSCDPKKINYKNIELFEVITTKSGEWICEISSRAIGKGSFRSIRLIKVKKEEYKENEKPFQLYIAKAPLNKGYYENIEQIKDEWRGSLIAQNMAKFFNKDLFKFSDKEELSINFNDVFILKSNDNKFYAIEKVIEGPFTKYNNNWGYLADFSSFTHKAPIHFMFNEVAQTFSHYSYQKSDGNILICDLQGVVQRLTDPIILSANPTKLQGDLSGCGILKFFEKHKCNDICQALKLEKLDEKISDEKKKEMNEIEKNINEEIEENEYEEKIEGVAYRFLKK